MKRAVGKLSVEELEDRLAFNVGGLDPTFGVEGKVRFDFGARDILHAVVVQADGKIVAGGVRQDFGPTGEDYALARFNPDGSLDETFGDGGRVRTNFSGASNETILGMALQADGKIVAVGQSILGVGRIALARYNPDGSLDNSFGAAGLVVTQISAGSNDKVEAVLVLANGQIVVAGEYQPNPFLSNYRIAALRYHSDGRLDTSFGNAGATTLDFGPGLSQTHALAEQNDGKLILVGQAANNRGVALARLNSDGSPDPNFGTQGQVITDVPGFGFERGDEVTVLGDGRIVVAGNIGNLENHTSDLLLLRYNSDGSLDGTFADDGILTLDLGGTHEAAMGLAILPSQEIVVVGEHHGPGSGFALAAQFGTDGRLVAGFTIGFATEFQGDFRDVVLLQDGRLVAGGTLGRGGSDLNFGLARFTVTNPPPLADAGGPYTVDNEGKAKLFGFNGDDPQPLLATLTFEWDLDGDGHFGEVGTEADNGDEIGSAPTFVATGNMARSVVQVALRLTDSEGRQSTDQTTINVVGLRGIALKDRRVEILGSAGTDVVAVHADDLSIEVHAVLDGVKLMRLFLREDVDDILVRLFEGNDRVRVRGRIPGRTILDGGQGADFLRAGNGPAVLIGGDGADQLWGGGGRNVLIGGLGRDELRGNAQSDILIGGKTSHDTDVVALDAILAEWDSERNYEERKANLRGESAGQTFDERLNGMSFLTRRGDEATVIDDGAVDSLAGGDGIDWILAGRGDVLAGRSLRHRHQPLFRLP